MIARWEHVDGKCGLCGRVQLKGRPVLRLRQFKGRGVWVMRCDVCRTEWEAATKSRVLKQRAW